MNNNNRALPPVHRQNGLKILLGLALVHRDQPLFQQAASQLGNYIKPFSKDFEQAAITGFSASTRDLLELSLKACLISPDDNKTCPKEVILEYCESIIGYGLKYNYLLSVDE